MFATPALLGHDRHGRDYIIEKAGSISVYDGRWKYIAPSKGLAYNKLTDIELGNAPEAQLYDLKHDLSEQYNVASQHPDIVTRLQQLLQAEVER